VARRSTSGLPESSWNHAPGRTEERMPVPGGRVGGRTRSRLQIGFGVRPDPALDRNSKPAIAPVGDSIHSRRPRPRSGNAASRIDACRRTRPREVGDSAITTRRATDRGRQPRSAAMSGASRVFRSRPCRSDCRSAITDFTSMTSRVSVGRCQASTSTDPRSPQIENDTSMAVAHPSRVRRSTAAATVCAWASSRSRSSCSPRQRIRRSRLAPSAATTRSISTRRTSSARPSSMAPTTSRDTLARAASCFCVTFARIRRVRTVIPVRIQSIRAA
jgi:hypothetical protein